MEFDLLMQYYKKLRHQMSLIDAHELCHQFSNIELVIHYDTILLQHKDIFEKYVPELILIRLASHLLSGKTHLFHEMLGVLENHRDVGMDTITMEIQVAFLRRQLGM